MMHTRAEKKNTSKRKISRKREIGHVRVKIRELARLKRRSITLDFSESKAQKNVIILTLSFTRMRVD